MGPDRPVLLLEDDAAICQSLKTLLEASGYTVACAANGREALLHLRRTEPPSVILLDLAMPVMSGRQFRQEQRHDPALAAIPIVVLSGEDDLPQLAADLGAAGYFGKPVDVEGLLARLRVLAADRPGGVPTG